MQPGPATWFWLDVPTDVASGVPFDVTLYALHAYGHLATGYTGTVTFCTTDKDKRVVMPANYTFTANDQGIHTFPGETVLVTPGEQYLRVLDTDGKLAGEALLMVGPSGAPGGHGGQQRTVPDWALATDLVRALTRRAEQVDGFWAVPPEGIWLAFGATTCEDKTS